MTYALGIDFGTSGARAIVIDAEQVIQTQTSQTFLPATSASATSAPAISANPAHANTAIWNTVIWQATLYQLLAQIPIAIRHQIQAIALNGTSSTSLIVDAQGQPLRPALMYNDARAIDQIQCLRAIAPPHHTVLSSTSSLAKLLWYRQQPEFVQARYFLHQADWLGFLLHGQLGISDYHNSLKLGYDVALLRYPDWLLALDIAPLLPQVVTPGQAIGPIHATIAQTFELPPDCCVCAGTTDSIAAFLASGATQPGEAVTSLGSTLVLKLLSTTRVDDDRTGIYSHRLGEHWLVGGASNTGGAVLRHFFTDSELARLSQTIDPTRPSAYDYYPLIQPGERFPINDPQLLPQLEPRPIDDGAFLQGLLDGMARIEAKGYSLLQQMGGSPLNYVYTAGGGAQNSAWSAIRQRYLGVPVTRSVQTEAAYGTATLALNGALNGALDDR